MQQGLQEAVATLREEMKVKQQTWLAREQGLLRTIDDSGAAREAAELQLQANQDRLHEISQASQSHVSTMTNAEGQDLNWPDVFFEYLLHSTHPHKVCLRQSHWDA